MAQRVFVQINKDRCSMGAAGARGGFGAASTLAVFLFETHEST